MTVDWTGGGPDLVVPLDRRAGPLGIQIQDQLRAAIRDRRLHAGERLPSTRHLAEMLGVSRGTVVDAYEQLLAEGYVDSAAGSGTRVATMSAADVPDLPGCRPGHRLELPTPTRRPSLSVHSVIRPVRCGRHELPTHTRRPSLSRMMFPGFGAVGL